MRALAPSARGLTLVLAALAVLLLLWYLFRPERLFINRTVNEPPPQSVLLRARAPVADAPPVSPETDLPMTASI
jgi:hypothetical protein